MSRQFVRQQQKVVNGIKEEVMSRNGTVTYSLDQVLCLGAVFEKRRGSEREK